MISEILVRAALCQAKFAVMLLYHAENKEMKCKETKKPGERKVEKSRAKGFGGIDKAHSHDAPALQPENQVEQVCVRVLHEATLAHH